MLFPMSKIQFLKAIHNTNINSPYYFRAVSDVKDTIFESNSQQWMIFLKTTKSCFRCQRYNFWKQFTTYVSIFPVAVKLFPMSKIQFLKAIHNYIFCLFSIFSLFPMSKIQFLKAIHNLNYFITFCYKLFPMSKIQFLKAIHNLLPQSQAQL